MKKINMLVILIIIMFLSTDVFCYPTPLGSTTVGQALKNDLNSEGKWNQITFADDTVQTTASGGGGGSPGGLTTQIQYNNAGAFAGLSTFTTDGTDLTLTGILNGATIDLGASVYATRGITVDTGGVFDINLGTAAGDDFTIDTSAFVVEGDTGFVGIGTATPAHPLVINGPITTWGADTQMSLGQKNRTHGFYFCSADVNQSAIGFSAEATGGAGVNLSDANAWTARYSTAYMFLQFGDNIFFCADKGLTAGNIYTPTRRLAFNVNGNVGIGTYNFNSSATGVLALYNGTAPAAGTTNQTYLYSVAGEGYWMDSAGNATLQTPHASDAPVWLYDKAPGEEQVSKSYNTFIAEITFVNNDRRNKLVEMQLNGEQLPAEKRFRITESFAEYNARTGSNLQVADWSEAQKEYVSAENERLIAAAMSEKVQITEDAAYVDAEKIELKAGVIKDKDTGRYYRMKTREEVEPLITKVIAKQPPQWMQDKGVAPLQKE